MRTNTDDATPVLPSLGETHTGMRVDYSGLLRQARNGLHREPSLADMN